MTFKSIGVIADKRAEAQAACDILCNKYDISLVDDSNEDCDVIIALGGDGFMLHTLHNFMNLDIPIYGMNRGTVGFLMNEYKEDNLIERLNKAGKTVLHPLAMKAKDIHGKTHTALAINEVSLLRNEEQAAKIKISIDNKTRMEEMVCDGVLVSTPAGSSAYNFSAGGPILPLRSDLLALTPISAFRPRRWGGALLQNDISIRFDVLDPENRPVDAVADFNRFENVEYVEVSKDKSKELTLLFDPGHSLEERILNEQFAYA